MSTPGWGAPPYGRPPTSGNRGLIAGLAIGLAVLLAATVGVVSWLSPARIASPPAAPAGSTTSAAPAPSATASSTSASPTRTASPTPTAGPSSASRSPTSGTSSAPPPKATPPPRRAPQPSAPNTSLTRNSLYRVDLSGAGRCKAQVRRPKPPVADSRLAAYLRSLLPCLMDAFRAPLAAQGFTLTTPTIKTFTSSVRTPCGTVRASSNPAFYCANTIYWPVSSDNGREAYTFARLGYVGLLAHEFGHHIQATTGILRGYGVASIDASRSQRLELSRRLELQAQCFEGVFLAHDRSALSVGSRDRREIRAWHSFTGDEDPPASRKADHGTSKAQVAWLEKGMAGADFGRCNTWTASRSSTT